MMRWPHAPLAPALALALVGGACRADSQLAPADAPPGAWPARVVRVIDGDTLVVLRDRDAITVRLSGVDAPERSQSFGRRAKDFALYTAIGRLAAVRSDESDHHGRTVGEVWIGGERLGDMLLQQGLAWHYREYSSDENLARLEDEARQAKRGLWRDPAPIAPWEWRKAKREKREPVSSRPIGDAEALYHGNHGSKVYHARGCEHFDCKNCTQLFASREAAEAEGYHAHAACVGD